MVDGPLSGSLGIAIRWVHLLVPPIVPCVVNIHKSRPGRSDSLFPVTSVAVGSAYSLLLAFTGCVYSQPRRLKTR